MPSSINQRISHQSPNVTMNNSIDDILPLLRSIESSLADLKAKLTLERKLGHICGAQIGNWVDGVRIEADDKRCVVFVTEDGEVPVGDGQALLGYARKMLTDPEADPAADDEWRREMAMEAGHLHGVEAWNDAMGYG